MHANPALAKGLPIQISIFLRSYSGKTIESEPATLHLRASTQGDAQVGGHNVGDRVLRVLTNASVRVDGVDLSTSQIPPLKATYIHNRTATNVVVLTSVRNEAGYVRPTPLQEAPTA